MKRRRLAAAAAAFSLAALLGTMPLRGAGMAPSTTEALQSNWASISEATDAGARSRTEKCADARTAERRVPGRCSST